MVYREISKVDVVEESVYGLRIHSLISASPSPFSPRLSWATGTRRSGCLNKHGGPKFLWSPHFSLSSVIIVKVCVNLRLKRFAGLYQNKAVSETCLQIIYKLTESATGNEMLTLCSQYSLATDRAFKDILVVETLLH